MNKQTGKYFEFDSTKCAVCGGKCCCGESGYIWLTPNEISNLARFKGVSEAKFCELYTIKVGVRISLKEKEYNGGLACVFFDEKRQNCSVYEVRPAQCETFPFWEYYESRLEELEKECIGVTRL